jgi:hypothetical protein
MIVTSGRRTLDEVLWGDSLFDPYTALQLERLADAGPSPAPGNAVEVRE